MIYIGIDPGLSGAIASIRTQQQEVMSFDILEGKPREINAVELHLYLRVLLSDDPQMFCVLENVHAVPQWGVTQCFQFGMSMGTIKSVLRVLSIPFELVNPKTWKQAMIGKTSKDKNKSIRRCQELFPKINLVPEGCKNPNDNWAEALLLAEYGRRFIRKG